VGRDRNPVRDKDMLGEMRQALVGATVSAAIALAAAPPASARGTDRASARAFLAHAATFLRIAVSRDSQLKTAARQFIEHLRASCPNALASAPPAIVEHGLRQPPSKEGMEGTPAQRATSQAFLTMAIGELRIAHDAPIRAPALGFASEIAHLRWTQPAVARAVAGYGRGLLATLALKPPDFCADARASATAGFAVAPPEAVRFVKAYNAARQLSTGRSLGELATIMQPLLTDHELETLAEFQRRWVHAKPLLEISDATVRYLLRIVYQSHRAS
jgi:hypothetical protein